MTGEVSGFHCIVFIPWDPTLQPPPFKVFNQIYKQEQHGMAIKSIRTQTWGLGCESQGLAPLTHSATLEKVGTHSLPQLPLSNGTRNNVALT